MLSWYIVSLAGARLKASVLFPLLKRMYQGGTCKGRDITWLLCPSRMIRYLLERENSSISFNYSIK